MSWQNARMLSETHVGGEAIGIMMADRNKPYKM